MGAGQVQNRAQRRSHHRPAQPGRGEEHVRIQEVRLSLSSVSVSGAAYRPVVCACVGLEAVEEHSNEQPAEASPLVEDSAMPLLTQNGFRSGTLAVRHPLPRRKRAGSRLQAQSEPQTVVETTPQTHVLSPAPPTSPVTTIEMKRELDIGDDPLSLTYPSYPTSRGESTSEHGTAEYREGYGFDIDLLDLITQQVYPSQSQP